MYSKEGKCVKMRYKVRFTFIDTNATEHTMEATFPSFQLAITKVKAFALKNTVDHIVDVEIHKVEEG